MKSVLFTVFRTDLIEKINLLVSTLENLSSDRLKSVYSATENSSIIEKKNRVASCVVCVLCLFLAVLWVSLETVIVFFLVILTF